MLSEPEKGKIEVSVVKNKSDNEGSKIYEFKRVLGLLGNLYQKMKIKLLHKIIR